MVFASVTRVTISRPDRICCSASCASPGFADTDVNALARTFNRQDANALYEAIGAGTIRLDQVARRVLAERQRDRDRATPRPAVRRSAQRFAESEFYIYGVGDPLTRTAHCCMPTPGNEIAGYLTHGRGVTIHRADCGNLLHLQATQPRRVLQVSLGVIPTTAYEIKLRISAYDRAGLLRDVTARGTTPTCSSWHCTAATRRTALPASRLALKCRGWIPCAS